MRRSKILKICRICGRTNWEHEFIHRHNACLECHRMENRLRHRRNRARMVAAREAAQAKVAALLPATPTTREEALAIVRGAWT